MGLDGLRRKGVALVSYEDDEWWLERAILGFLGDSGVVVCTPHWDVYVEQVEDYESLRVLGPRGGGIPAAVSRTGRVVRFDHGALQERWDALLAQAARGEPDMREHAERDVLPLAEDGAGDSIIWFPLREGTAWSLERPWARSGWCLVVDGCLDGW